MYVVRTRFPSGCRQGPGRHSHDRVGTVLSGTLYVGFGDRFDEDCVTRVGAGRTWTVPARTTYFLWAKEGDVLVQVMGNG